MNLERPMNPPELAGLHGDKALDTLRAQLALHGIELHRQAGQGGAAVYLVRARGQVSSFDAWPELLVYVRGLGLAAVS